MVWDSMDQRPFVEGQSMSKPENGARTLSLSDRVRSLKLPKREAEPPRFAWFPWTMCALFAGTTVYLAVQAYVLPLINGGGKSTTVEAAPTDKASEPVGDSYNGADGITLESKGYIIPVQQILVSPKVGGMVLELNIVEGTHVKEGEILARLEDVEYQAEYDRVKGMTRAAEHRALELTKYRDQEIKQTKAELNDAKAQREHAFTEWKRKADLRGSLSVSQSEYDQAFTNYKSMEHRAERLQLAYDLIVKGPRDEKIQTARAELEQTEAELVKAKWKLDNCTVRAPVSGTILVKRAEKGNMVNPSAFSNGLSASLCEMADLTNMEVELSIAERDIRKVFKGQKCLVRAEAFEDRPYNGIVSRIMPLADRSKGAVPVRVKIDIPHDEEGKYLRPEMGAIVTFYEKSETRNPAVKSETNSKTVIRNAENGEP